MDSLELNKVIAAVLVAGIAFMGATLVSDALVHPVMLSKPAIAIKGAAPAGAGTPEQDPPVAALLASADPHRGELDTQQAGCIACHSFDKGGKAGVGPNLYGVVGAPHGHMPGYEYSSALKSKQGPWTYDELYEWLKKPAAYAPGTKMTFAGLPDPRKRAEIISYLRTLSDNPEPLPPAPAGAQTAANTAPAAAAPPAGGEDPPIATLLPTADPKKGQALTLQAGCIACHTFTPGGPAGVGPNLYNVVGGPHAHMAGYAYSDALKAHAGPWTDAELYRWIKNPAAYAPGTKMTFAGMPDPRQRADVIAYLHTLSPDPIPLTGAATPAAAKP
jgi:cytochrome c